MALCDEEWEEDPAGHEARMGLMRNVYNMKTRDRLGDLDMNWSITLKDVLQK
jgi:hypothetical protein